ncbi:MAG: hypothetical protein ACI9DK_001301, partial [Vicingaceae bacterium]
MKNIVLQKIKRLEINGRIGQKEGFISTDYKVVRSSVVKHFKIIYTIAINSVFVFDLFETRQSPERIERSTD